jgi:hypothetical protein
VIADKEQLVASNAILPEETQGWFGIEWRFFMHNEGGMLAKDLHEKSLPLL